MFTFAWHLYFFPSVFSFTAVLADVLVILAAVIPYGPGRMWQEFLISAYTCMGILGLMVLCIIGLLFWRRGLSMPRKPDTVGAVMTYLCASRGLDRVGLKWWDGNRVGYMYGRFEGLDGVSRWMIDAVR